MHELTSRERMLRTIDGGTADHVPCCFMSFAILRARCDEDRYRVALAEAEMGLDPMLFIPSAPRRARPEHPDLRGLPVRFDPRVESETWRETIVGGAELLHRRYVTPAGELQTTVRLSADWPHGNRIPFVDDYQVPRAVKPLIGAPEDLAALQYLLLPPGEDDVAAFEAEARQARAFADRHGVLLAGGWGVGLDMANWLCGMQELIVATIERPQFVAELLERIHAWNVARMEVVLAPGIDLYIRRAWYEGRDMVTPRFFRDAVLPGLKAEAALAHRHGARFGYICSSGVLPMVDMYVEAGVDVLIGVDPIQDPHADLPELKRKADGRLCLWGGVSGAMTVEMGTEDEVRAAVRRAVEVLGPDRFILSPVDNLTVDAPRTWRNVEVLIDEWHRSLPDRARGAII
jgi:uroporphyrinogen-III decarboxylase